MKQLIFRFVGLPRNDTVLRKALETVRLEEVQNRTFEVIRVVEKLCEFCDKPLGREEKVVKTIQISSYNDYRNLFTRAKAHDRVEVDPEENKIYLCDHDYPGDVHSSCVEKYSEGHCQK